MEAIGLNMRARYFYPDLRKRGLWQGLNGHVKRKRRNSQVSA